MFVACEGCARHVQGSELVCPFCRVSRTRSTLAVLALSSTLALSACAAKYGGPPPTPDMPDQTEASTGNAPVGEPSVPGEPTTPGAPSTPPADTKTPPVEAKQPPGPSHRR